MPGDAVVLVGRLSEDRMVIVARATVCWLGVWVETGLQDGGRARSRIELIGCLGDEWTADQGMKTDFGTRFASLIETEA